MIFQMIDEAKKFLASEDQVYFACKILLKLLLLVVEQVYEQLQQITQRFEPYSDLLKISHLKQKEKETSLFAERSGLKFVLFFLKLLLLE